MTASQKFSPVTTAKRIVTIDILRGFALCGIYFINITAFAAPNQFFNIVTTAGLADRIVNSLLLLVVESKFFTLFSFLFGIGFAIQVMRAEAKRRSFVGRYLRRTSILALFGVLHILLLWEGDILLLYAIIGFLLIPFRSASVDTLRRWSFTLLGSVSALAVLMLVIVLIAGQIAPAELQLINEGFISKFSGKSDSILLLAQYESILAYFEERVVSYITSALLYATRVPTVLSMFLLGLMAGRLQILHEATRYRLLLRRVRFWGLVVGTSVSLLVTVANNTLPPITAVVALFLNQYISGPLQSMGMAAALVLLLQDPRWAQQLNPLAAYGRMSLTNYLAQSILAVLIFYGFGLVNQINLAVAMIIAAGLLWVEIVFSNWWLRIFHFGPLEWIWRSLTYGSLQPFRK